MPRLIALCGNPGAGKSTVQDILFRRYGYRAVNDGAPLRTFAHRFLGLSHSDIYTQEGKSRYTTIAGKTWQNRNVFGTLGVKLEEAFGPHIMPYMATQNLEPHLKYSFGSVRRSQGQFYQSVGAVVLEVINPNTSPSPYAFDQYDRLFVDFKIYNDGNSMRNLENEVDRVMKLATGFVRLLDMGDVA